MLRTRSYYDLCIEEKLFKSENLEEIIKNIHEMGFRTIAVNQVVEEAVNTESKKKKKGQPREEQDLVPVPYSLEQIEKIISSLKLDDFKVFNRLTVVFSNQSSLHKITKSSNYKKFHIIAAMPTTMQAITFTCSNLDADIFTYDPTQKFSHRLNKKMYNQLVERNFHIELKYSYAIEDSTKRKNLIHASHLFHTFGKSKNIIVSSGASDPFYIRTPYDIMNFGLLFGLNESKCKASVTENPRQVLLNSVGRRHGKSVMFVLSKPALEPVPVSDEEMEVDTEPSPKRSKLEEEVMIDDIPRDIQKKSSVEYIL